GRALELRPGQRIVDAVLLVGSDLAGIRAALDEFRSGVGEPQLADQPRRPNPGFAEDADLVAGWNDLLEGGQRRRGDFIARGPRVAGAQAVAGANLMIALHGVLPVVELRRFGDQQVCGDAAGIAEILLRPVGNRGLRRLDEARGRNAVAGEWRGALRIAQGKSGHPGKVAVPPRLHRHGAESLYAAALDIGFVIEEEE